MGPHATNLTTDLTIDQGYDTDGQQTKRVQTRTTKLNSQPSTTSQKTIYYLRSTVLGGRLISELNETGQKQKTYVYAGSLLLATQQVDSQSQPVVVFSHSDPVSQSTIQSDASGQAMLTIEGLRHELDPLGAEMPQSDPYTAETDPQIGGASNSGGYAKSGDPFNPESGCAWDGQSVPCSMRGSILRYSNLYTSYIQSRYEGAEGAVFGLSISGQVKRTLGHFKTNGPSKQGTPPLTLSYFSKLMTDPRLIFSSCAICDLFHPFL